MLRNVIRIVFNIVAAFAAFAVLPSRAFFIGDQPITVEEYLNDDTGHYFLVAPDEKRALDSGAAGTGWHPTGYRIGAFSYLWYGSAVPVYRFYAPSPNTHFFTASRFEYDLLASHPEWGWISEGAHFKVRVPVNGECGPHQAPVHRFYNDRFQFNDSNHRFVADGAVLNEMMARGWIDEGVAFCTDDARFVH